MFKKQTSATLSLCSSLTPVHDQIASRRPPWLRWISHAAVENIQATISLVTCNVTSKDVNSCIFLANIRGPSWALGSRKGSCGWSNPIPHLKFKSYGIHWKSISICIIEHNRKKWNQCTKIDNSSLKKENTEDGL